MLGCSADINQLTGLHKDATSDLQEMRWIELKQICIYVCLNCKSHHYEAVCNKKDAFNNF